MVARLCVYSEADTTEPPLHKRGASLDVRVKGTFLEDDSLRLRLRIADSSGKIELLSFPLIRKRTALNLSRLRWWRLSLESSAVEAIERDREGSEILGGGEERFLLTR